jgi:hypothetical protein
LSISIGEGAWAWLDHKVDSIFRRP